MFSFLKTDFHENYPDIFKHIINNFDCVCQLDWSPNI